MSELASIYTVHGYIRNNIRKLTIPDAIKRLIFTFYWIKFPSNILSNKEIKDLIQLLPNSDDIKEYKLLFQAKKYGFGKES